MEKPPERRSSLSPSLRFGLLCVLCACWSVGCASVKVKSSRSPQPPTGMPPLILVERFSFDRADVRVDRQDAELQLVQDELATKLQRALVERLPEIAPTREAAIGEISPNGWLIRGRFIRVYQGSRALRAALGFGLGATKLETRVEVFDLSRPAAAPWLVFETTGGSNAEPGAISGIGPVSVLTGVGIVSSGVTNAAHGLSEDTWRTARVIRNFLLLEVQRHQLMNPRDNPAILPQEGGWKAKKL